MHTALSFTLSLSLSGTEVLKMATQRIARIETTGGGFHFMFFLFTATPFSLKNGNLFFLFFSFFTVHGNPVSSSFLQIRMLFFECIRESRMHSKIWSDFVKSSLYY